MKKNILICLYAYYPFENANTNVMLPLIRELAQIYQVHILTENISGSASKYEVVDNIIIHRYDVDSVFQKFVNRLADMDMKKKRGWWKEFLIHLICPIARFMQKVVKKNEYIELSKLVKEIDFAMIITTCEVFTSHKNMLRLKKEKKNTTPWIAYFMDPFSYYIERRDTVAEVLEIEKEVYMYSDMVLVTEEIYRENQTNAFSPYIHKTFPFRFGNFRCVEHDLLNDIFVPNKINCVYVGSLWSEKIRSPRYLYRMINKLDNRFHFHIICNTVTDENKRLFDSMVVNKDNVSWYSRLPLDECLGIMSHADILINLGNKSVNQTPSKVFDYIGTGKPIVNIHSLIDDTSKYYLQRYPLKLNVFENEELLEENIQAFVEFAEETLGKVVPKEELLKEYQEYDSATVTQKTISLINKQMGVRGNGNVEN